MFKELATLKPNDLLRKFALVGDKGKPPTTSIDQAIAKLPIANADEPRVLGNGDWGRQRAKHGTVIMRWNEKLVAKAPFGKMYKDPIKWVLQQREVTRMLQEVSPATLVILAQVDTEEPKPVTIQEKVEGQPVGETPISVLFQAQVLRDLLRIIEALYVVYKAKNYGDNLCGQKIEGNKVTQFIISTIPLFSDNIMVTSENRALLTDNIPLSLGISDHKIWKSFVRHSRFLIAINLLKTLVFLKTFAEKKEFQAK